MTAQVRLTSSLELSHLPNTDNFINTTNLPLSAAPYSIAPLTTANRLWSSIHSSFLLFIIIIIFIWKREGIYERFLEQLLLNAWTRGSSGFAPFLDEGVASSFVHFSPYISYFLPHFLPFYHRWSSERELIISRTLLTLSCWTRCLCCHSYAEIITSQGTVYLTW